MGRRVADPRTSRAPAKFHEAPCPRCGAPHRVVNPLWLRWQRETAGLSQREFGALIGFSAPYLSDLERGRRDCTLVIREAYERL